MQRKYNFSNLKGDLSGALAAALLSMGGNIVYGMISFAPLGPRFVGAGIIAGMFSSVFNGLLATIFGSTKIMISGPVVPAAFILASVITKLIDTNHFHPASDLDMLSVISIIFFVAFLAGIFQILFGLLRLGTLVKNISYPVVLGIINGTSVLIISGQIGPCLGIQLDGQSGILNSLSQTSFPTLAVALSTMLIMFQASKYKTKFPSNILGIIGGTMIYYSLMFTFCRDTLGPVIGEVPFATPSLSNLFNFLNIFPDHIALHLFSIIIPAAFAIAVLGSIESLLAIVSLQNLTKSRPRGNRELIAQGIGNSVGAIFGGIPVSGYLGRTTINHSSGGRTKISGICCSVLILCFILILGKPIGYIPKSVMAGVVIYICIQLMNNRSIEIVKKLFTRKQIERSDLLLDLFIIVTVMVVVLTLNLIMAVAVGILVSIFVFIAQMGRSIVRSIHRRSQLISKKQRFEKSIEILEKHGDKIYVIGLEGALFFGSADNLVDQIETVVTEGGQYIVLDMKRIHRIDSTGCQVLEQTYLFYKEQNIKLVISYIDPSSNQWGLLSEEGLVSAFGRDKFFPDTSLAVEYLEDCILELHRDELDLPKEITLEALFKYKGIDERESRIISNYLEQVDFLADEKIISLGDTEQSMFFLVKGSVDVSIPISETRDKRLLTSTCGSIFGEMSLMDEGQRSANIVAREPTTCFKLSRDAFVRLKKEHPEVTMNLYAAIARITSEKLRAASHTISELEE